MSDAEPSADRFDAASPLDGGRPPAADLGADDALAHDAGDARAHDAGDARARDARANDMAPPDATPAPRAVDYCELSRSAFCAFYLRCGRMAVDDLETCGEVFLETCNARYEPLYVLLEARGDLSLSSTGLQACADHLAHVPCEQQIFDLDGPCQRVWSGHVPAGGACGAGIESFVCDADSTCALTMSLCGTCEPAAGPGDVCGEERRCRADAACLDGACVPRSAPGTSCEHVPCVLGARCEGDRCVTFGRVGEGDACDRERRCPYRSACIGGICVAQAMLGEPCGGSITCASGDCDAGECAPLRPEGAACEHAGACLSGVCASGLCQRFPGRCFE